MTQTTLQPDMNEWNLLSIVSHIPTQQRGLLTQRNSCAPNCCSASAAQCTPMAVSDNRAGQVPSWNMCLYTSLAITGPSSSPMEYIVTTINLNPITCSAAVRLIDSFCTIDPTAMWHALRYAKSACGGCACISTSMFSCPTWPR